MYARAKNVHIFIQRRPTLVLGNWVVGVSVCHDAAASHFKRYFGPGSACPFLSHLLASAADSYLLALLRLRGGAAEMDGETHTFYTKVIFTSSYTCPRLYSCSSLSQRHA